MAYYNNPYITNYGFQQPSYQQPAQSSGFVPIPSEEAARSCPIQRGSSVTFRDENLPYIYIKTLGFGQLDSPVFEKYRLVKEDSQNSLRQPESIKEDVLPVYATKAEFEALREEVEKLRKELGDEQYHTDDHAGKI